MKYPEDFLNKIICGDHLEIIKDIPHNEIHLTVTSPPYGDLRDYEGYQFDYKKLIPELYRVTKSNGVVVWVVADMIKDGSESGTSFKQALYFMECGFKLHDTMIYEKKGNRYPELTRYYQCFEYMFIFVKGKIKTYNLLKDRINLQYGKTHGNTERQKDGTIKKITKRLLTRDVYGVRCNIWKYNVGFQKSTKDLIAYEQPAIFPDLLAYDHIRSWSNENDIIFDPMCGSGTTCKVAKNNRRRYIGIDCSEKYCEISRERCNNNPLFEDT